MDETTTSIHTQNWNWTNNWKKGPAVATAVPVTSFSQLRKYALRFTLIKLSINKCMKCRHGNQPSLWSIQKLWKWSMHTAIHSINVVIYPTSAPPVDTFHARHLTAKTDTQMAHQMAHHSRWEDFTQTNLDVSCRCASLWLSSFACFHFVCLEFVLSFFIWEASRSTQGASRDHQGSTWRQLEPPGTILEVFCVEVIL